MQGAGGMHFYEPARAARAARRWCDAHDVLLIPDEIATGFGRTGALFAGEHAAIAPTPVRRQGADRRLHDARRDALHAPRSRDGISAGEAGGLMHGPTFMANPLACAIASANLELLDSRDSEADVRRIAGGLAAGLDARLPRRGRGAGDRGHRRRAAARAGRVAAATAAALERGVWLRPFSDLVYAMPPYVTGDDDLSTITSAVVGAVESAHG